MDSRASCLTTSARLEGRLAFSSVLCAARFEAAVDAVASAGWLKLGTPLVGGWSPCEFRSDRMVPWLPSIGLARGSPTPRVFSTHSPFDDLLGLDASFPCTLR